VVATTREDTNLYGDRLISLILIVAIAYSWATFKGQDIKNKGVQKYVGRVKHLHRINFLLPISVSLNLKGFEDFKMCN